MRHLAAALCALVIATSFSGAAKADGRAFPPEGCAAANSFMAFNGAENASTFCVSGQDIFKNAIPVCTQGQVVAYDGARFHCKSDAALPTCAEDEFLSYDGEHYVCKKTGVPPTCTTGNVLTYVTGTGFSCISNSQNVPTCTNGQFLTYNGSSFQCARVTTPAIPTCAAGQMVTANGTSLSCTNALVVPTCGQGQMLTGSAGQLVCVDQPGAANSNPEAHCINGNTWNPASGCGANPE